MLKKDFEQMVEKMLSWKSDEVMVCLKDYSMKQNNLLDFPTSVSAFHHAQFDFHDLYNTLVSEFGLDAVCQGFAEILEHDPSIEGKPYPDFENAIKEKPFPRYIVGIVYVILAQCFEEYPETIKQAVWNNILNTNLLGLWPEFSTEVLLLMYEIKDLLQLINNISDHPNKDYRIASSEIQYQLTGQALPEFRRKENKKLSNKFINWLCQSSAK